MGNFLVFCRSLPFSSLAVSRILVDSHLRFSLKLICIFPIFVIRMVDPNSPVLAPLPHPLYDIPPQYWIIWFCFVDLMDHSRLNYAYWIMHGTVRNSTKKFKKKRFFIRFIIKKCVQRWWKHWWVQTFPFFRPLNDNRRKNGLVVFGTSLCSV